MLTQVKSHLILQTILNNIDERKAMKLIRYNKAHQKKLKLTLEDFKNFIQVKVEVIPVHWDKLKKAKNFFVNFGKDKNKFLVYFNLFFLSAGCHLPQITGLFTSKDELKTLMIIKFQ